MAGIVEPVYGPDWGQLLQQGFNTYQGIRGIQRQNAEDERVTQDRQKKEKRDAQAAALRKRIMEQGDGKAFHELAALDPKAANEIKDLYAAQDQQRLYQKSATDPTAWKELQQKYPEQAAAYQKQQNVDLDRFYKERGQTALELRGQTPETQIKTLERRVKTISDRGGDPSNTQRLLDMVRNGEDIGPVLSNVVEQSYQSGYLKRPPEQKIPSAKWVRDASGQWVNLTDAEGPVMGYVKPPEQGAYRFATAEEKAAQGLDPSQPYQVSPQGKFIKTGGSGQTINVNTGQPVQFGQIPQGYGMRLNKAGEWEQFEVKGGPADKKSEAEKKAENKKIQSEEIAGGVVTDDINRLTGMIERQKWYDPITGVGGEWLFTNIPSSARKDAEALRTTISTNVGFDRLQRMRDESPTGGALGQVSEQEMKQLMSVLGNLDFSQSDGQILYNLKRLNRIYSQIKKKADAYPNADKYGFGVQATPAGAPAPTGMPPEMLDRYK